MTIRQAMILAAGKGSRMRPLTSHTPKPLVPVADKPLIIWHIERLRDAGIEDIVINAGYLAQKLIDALTQLSLGVNLHISDESSFREPLETAGGIKYALANNLLRNEPFILVNGDVWTEYDFTKLVKHELKERLAHLVLVENPEHNESGDFGLDGQNIRLKESGCLTHTFAGLSVLSPKMVDGVVAGQAVPLAPFLKQAAKENLVTGELMTEKWVDVGTLERLGQVNTYVENLKNYD
ncbi:nucleotidyltransferase family protein [Moraxella sp. Tifton1]|uniref:NDP-sugar synthase n=1 Tax=Moraxella oculi TaxID=2940516 RepID=A0ABW8U5L9_9GAMM|nr:nucleotidyltransferase family protein [Moraxella sp. Tifton1]MCL1623748.1 nucleotidyltransferase family protein [Moraxella sp. Tifton1]